MRTGKGLEKEGSKKNIYANLEDILEKLKSGNYELKILSDLPRSHPHASQAGEYVDLLDKGDMDVIGSLLGFLGHEMPSVRKVALAGLLNNYSKLGKEAEEELLRFCRTPQGCMMVFSLVGDSEHNIVTR